MEKIIRCASVRDIDAMKALWAECFPNDIEYAAFFFERIFKLECARVAEANGEIAAMLHSFPYCFNTPEGELSAKYIYGVGTAKKFRSLGLAGELLQAEASSCDFTVIIPQSESLFDFYKRHGYTEIFKVAKAVAKPLGKVPLKRAGKEDTAKLNAMYESMCEGSIHPIRSYERWETIMAEFEFLGGGISLFDGGYCVHYEYNGKQEISELCPPHAASPFGEECSATTLGEDVRLGAARLISDRAKKIFTKGYGRYLNLMHN